MTETISSVTSGSAELYYSISGSGPQVMFLFHGFGQTRKAFPELRDTCSGIYTFYSFDLIFHGQSLWHSEEPMQKNVLIDLIKQVIQKHNISSFSLTAFSMGARFALVIAEHMPECVNTITLLAPDGIKTSFWYSLATIPGVFRNIFHYMIDHPKLFFRLSRLLYTLRLVDKGLIRFADNYMDTRDKRMRVYRTWVVLRPILPDLQKVAQHVNDRQIPIRIFVGIYDRVITPKNMKAFAKTIPDLEIIELKVGHNALPAEVAKYFTR